MMRKEKYAITNIITNTTIKKILGEAHNTRVNFMAIDLDVDDEIKLQVATQINIQFGNQLKKQFKI